MGLYEIIVKTEEVRRQVQEGDFIRAQKILDTMELKKIKNVSDLSLMAEVYTKNARYEEAYELLLKINNKTRARKSVFQLVQNAIYRENAEEAERYFTEYKQQAPKDFHLHIFRYQIDKLKNAPIELQIESLKVLKKREYIEKWAYELAKLYYRADMEEECVRECSDIILWFGSGVFVEKAKVLKSYYSGEDKDKILADLKKRARKSEKALEDEAEKEATKGDQQEACVFIKEEEDEALSEKISKEVEQILAEDENDITDPSGAEDQYLHRKQKKSNKNKKNRRLSDNSK